MKHLLLIAALVVSGGCAGSNIYRGVANVLFPPPSGYGLGPVYTVSYARVNGDQVTERSYSRFNESYQELLSEVSDCTSDLDARLDQPGGRINNPAIEIAAVQLLECLQDRGWLIGVEAMWITN
jgi:hypothetical protein